jgi:hypothetical protein
MKMFQQKLPYRTRNGRHEWVLISGQLQVNACSDYTHYSPVGDVAYLVQIVVFVIFYIISLLCAFV